MKALRQTEILGYLPTGTRVPAADSPSVCDGYHPRTIGPKYGIRETSQVSLWAEAGVNVKQESPERDQYL